jgi:diguanylate cyclase (GGDEF)-like protein/PAS domain S-box-containing protein
VVQPVFAGSALIGYVELGKEIEDILQARRVPGLELAVVIRKKYLNRQTWEEGMRFLNREADWDRQPYSVVIYASQGRLPDAFAPMADHDMAGIPHQETDREIAFAGKDWRVFAMPLPDASGQEVGDLLIMFDITAEHEAFVRLLALGGTVGGVLLTLLLSFIVVLLRRTDAGIYAQQAALQNTVQFQKDLMDAIPSPLFYKDTQGVYRGGNQAFAHYLGLSREQIIGKTVYDLSPADLAEIYDQADQALLNNPGLQSYEASVVYADGTRHEVIFNKATFSNAEGQVMGLIGIILDITERKHAEEKLRLAASVFSHAREGILITTADGTIIEVNDAFSRITGYSREEVIGQNPRILKSGLQNKEFYAALWRDLIEKGHWYGEIWNRRKNGTLFAEMQNISNVCDDQGQTREYVALFSDITAIKEHENQLEHIAHYDTLTMLPNRVLLADRLRQAMAQTQRRQQSLAVAFLDLDGFKAINDTHGHEAGDQLLMAVATGMKLALREGDTIARIGGDEFVAVLIDLADLEASSPLLTRLLDAAAQPVPFGDVVLQVSASLGVTFYPQAEEIDADQLQRQADQAMYQAKLAGKNRYHIFDAEQDRNIRSHHENREHIRRALAQREFVLYYQPKVNLRTGTVIGAEALIRWQHPEQGLLLPAAFLSVIEDHPLAVELGEWVIETALTQMETWQATGLDLPVSVNVGARQLQQADFFERLCTRLAEHPQVKPSSLELEVLETSALEDLSRISQVITACGKIGVRFALDDFGTGYSSLTYLKRLPVTVIKIDQSFVSDLLDDSESLAILVGMLDLATAFRRQAIAQGVESLEHGEMLLQLGCELAQGYGIAHPMPAHAVPGWLAAWRPDSRWVDRPAVSRNDLPILFAGVEHRAWVAAIENHLQGQRDAPPPLEAHQCRFGAWLEAESLVCHGMRQFALAVIATLHQQAHLLAVELLELHARGQNRQALARLAELRALRNRLQKHLGGLLQDQY